MTLVSGGIRFMQIFTEVPWGGTPNDSGVGYTTGFYIVRPTN